MKKAQGISVNVIIIAAIALIVLVVLIAVFTGRFGLFAGGIKEAANCDKACQGLGYTSGNPVPPPSTCGGDYQMPGYVDEEGRICCCSK